MSGALAIARCAVEDILALRHAVLRAALPPEAARFPGDESGAHFAARRDGTVVGCASLMLVPYGNEPAWQLRGMAIAPGMRGMGVGRLLLQAAEEHARAATPLLLWCNAREPAIGFYARLGWGVDSQLFDIPTAGPHRRMSRRLDRPEVNATLG